ncbi:EpsD family peptidyl-prolyl cis-trans isomerase [Aromatoleum anaerobium]|uniref:Peptidyl-prolyl cis-trans isomerase, EpsD family n=1 Tax=Aromatoleum anaerobium TaxID=182180 RepID=A0ABX1PGY8_9RHOO|nr:EpsD family peptidyl-prolyl cis-trans isomerase [Aromatoleum anaerobium]MCK0507736.1 EpsD family peptidyl-prolyl cis-trans isomerase [Aromatoleum anaerobium]
MAVAAVLAIVLAACSPAPPEDVAARVNGTVISAAELDLTLQHLGVPQHDNEVRRRQLEKLVIEELLAQQFLRSTPGSARVDESAVSAARREILARRYIMDLVNGIPPPQDGEIEAFYQANPAMFAQRRIFALREFEISAPASRETELRQHLRAAHSLAEFADWLRREELPFVITEAERGAEELPPEVAAQLATLKEGEVALLPAPTGLRVIEIVRASASALDENAARPLIERRLWTEKRVAAVDAEVRRLSRMAAISILDGTGRKDAGGIPGLSPGAAAVLAPALSLP